MLEKLLGPTSPKKENEDFEKPEVVTCDMHE